ncbi:MAG: cirA 5 [Verrucomicrobia bacterium]|nr:cirA 5 [Verrucomicrobiota bacterium]
MLSLDPHPCVAPSGFSSKTAPLSRTRLALFVLVTARGAAAAFANDPLPLVLQPVIVTAGRTPQAAAASPLSVDVFTGDRLQASPSLVVDGALLDSAAFSLFRRSGSLGANPTAQGVSLRGIGPSGASRSLVLLDGIPLNDPFGGWVAWTKLPEESLTRAEVVRGGGSGAWGNAALGGVVQLLTSPEPGVGKGGRRAGSVVVQAGELGTQSAEVRLSENAASGTLGVDARHFETEGFYPIEAARRGPVDRRLSSEHRLLNLSWNGPVSETIDASATVRWFEENRGNGTALQRNDSKEGFVSLGLKGAPGPATAWSATAYFQDQSFSSFFSSVNAARTAETPANDQYDVPAKAAGAAWSGSWRRKSSTTTVGADVRWVEGETREYFLYALDRFTRRRIAGGEQVFSGVFAHHDHALTPTLDATAELRADLWQNTGGHRQETDLASGASVRDDRFASRRGTELNPQLGLSWRFFEGWRARAAVYRAFRVPTLNEYYRPFRVGIINTEANPGLKEESLLGGEVGVEFRARAIHLGATIFRNDLHEAVGNVTLSSTPSLISRQRQNLDLVRVQGAELSGEWTPAGALTFRIDCLVSNARVERATVQPALEHRRLAEVPRQTVVAAIEWKPAPTWRLGARWRHTGDQFEDDENQLVLAPATTVDVRVSHFLGRRWEIFGAVENLADARIETGRSNDNLPSVGSPRLARAGVRCGW